MPAPIQVRRFLKQERDRIQTELNKITVRLAEKRKQIVSLSTAVTKLTERETRLTLYIAYLDGQLV